MNDQQKMVVVLALLAVAMLLVFPPLCGPSGGAVYWSLTASDHEKTYLVVSVTHLVLYILAVLALAAAGLVLTRRAA